MDGPKKCPDSVEFVSGKSNLDKIRGSVNVLMRWGKHGYDLVRNHFRGRFDSTCAGRCRSSTWLYGILRHHFLKARELAARRIVGARVRASTNKFKVKVFRLDLTRFLSPEYVIIATVVAHG